MIFCHGSLFLSVIGLHILDASFNDSDNPVIQLQEFRQSDCITDCSRGLLSNYDALVLQANILNTDSIDTNKYNYVISVEMRNSSDFTKIKEIPLTSCLNLKSHYFDCKNEQNNYKITIKLMALVSMDRNDFIVALSYDKFRLESNTIRMTSIYDSFQASHYLNGKLLPSKQCKIQISKHSPLIFCCGKDVNVSTTIELYRNGESVAKAEHCVSYEELSPEELPKFSFNCNFCNTTLENITCPSNMATIFLISCIAFPKLKSMIRKKGSKSTSSFKDESSKAYSSKRTLKIDREKIPCRSDSYTNLFSELKIRGIPHKKTKQILNTTCDIDATLFENLELRCLNPRKETDEDKIQKIDNDHKTQVEVSAIIEKTEGISADSLCEPTKQRVNHTEKGNIITIYDGLKPKTTKEPHSAVEGIMLCSGNSLALEYCQSLDSMFNI
ncbi:uncharacterized protein LOC106068412 isoform X2 [Biomphalaria glabrata]|uniref:Uncharacterized protein LOC106068412 isoform X2 n=2 Tax=Biomphalaria glabrata TaxID=6526 RepID=A0A9W2YWN4_BIOGL|nr:uncharacterized protein LOC106068412 isoform X2 [Biomphalaria glabrata]